MIRETFSPAALSIHAREGVFDQRTCTLDSGGRPSSTNRDSLGWIPLAGLGLNKGEDVSNDDTGDKHCRRSSTLTAIGGNDGILVCGDIEGDFAGVGKCGRGKSDTVGDTLGLSPANCCNGISGDSGVARASFSFAFSC